MQLWRSKKKKKIMMMVKMKIIISYTLMLLEKTLLFLLHEQISLLIISSCLLNNYRQLSWIEPHLWQVLWTSGLLHASKSVSGGGCFCAEPCWMSAVLVPSLKHKKHLFWNISDTPALCFSNFLKPETLLQKRPRAFFYLHPILNLLWKDSIV